MERNLWTVTQKCIWQVTGFIPYKSILYENIDLLDVQFM